MLGMAVMHLLPHAWIELQEARPTTASLDTITLWLLLGFLAIFLLERFFCFHHHEPPQIGHLENFAYNQSGQSPLHRRVAETKDHQITSPQASHRVDKTPNAHTHTLNWAGATIGLTVHSILAGIALAASVRAESSSESFLPLAGFGTFLIIVLHKPFDSFTIGTLMAASGKYSAAMRHLVNALFALAIPVGIILFEIGFSVWAEDAQFYIAAALAFSAGMFLCVALSDLLPELQFHHHDRIPLSLALIAGIALAFVVGIFEGHAHGHGHGHGHSHEHVPPADADSADDEPYEHDHGDGDGHGHGHGHDH